MKQYYFSHLGKNSEILDKQVLLFNIGIVFTISFQLFIKISYFTRWKNSGAKLRKLYKRVTWSTTLAAPVLRGLGEMQQ